MADRSCRHILFSDVFGLLLVLFFVACDKDDVCIQELVTPRMNMVFLSAETNEQAPVDTLKVIRLSDGVSRRINSDSISVDSVLATLDITFDTSTFIFEYPNSQSDTVVLNYQRSDMFVNKACGFKTLFSNLAIQNHTTNKIIRIQVNEQTIESEGDRHLLIYF